MVFRRHSGLCQEKKDGKTPIKNKKTAEIKYETLIISKRSNDRFGFKWHRLCKHCLSRICR